MSLGSMAVNLLQMSFGSLAVTLSLSAAVTGYLLYVAVPVPSAIEKKAEVFTIFARRKLIRGLSIVGEYLRLGHRMVLARSVASVIGLSERANYTDVKVKSEFFNGVHVRIHDPVNRVNQSPAFIWIHGGGWVTGSAENDEFFTLELARRLNILIVSLNYRLAPEDIFPASFDDCVTATTYFLDQSAAEYNVDVKRVAIGGASAGGNLAAAVSLKLRDLEAPHRPSIQVLVVPCLQAFDFNTPSYQQNRDNVFLPKSWMINYWLWYALGFDGHYHADHYSSNHHTSPTAKTSQHSKFVDHNLISRKHVPNFYVPNKVSFGDPKTWDEIKGVFLNPYFAPLMAEDLKGLPEAYIATAEWDVLRDDGLMYGRRLVKDGVEVELKHYEKGYHALFSRPEIFELSRKFMDDLCEYLSSRL